MKLTDQIIDEATLLAEHRIMSVDMTDEEVIDMISDLVGVSLAYNSCGARLGLAAYNRVMFAMYSLKETVA